jgi:hypothetical protein
MNQDARVRLVALAILACCVQSWVFAGAAPTPTVTSVSPNTGPIAGGTSVTITGTNFVAGATVTFGSAAATGVSVTNSTTIAATTPGNPAGAVTVTVTNAGGGSPSGSLPSGFTYTSSSGPPTNFRFLTTSLPDGSTNAVYSDTVITANAAGPITFGASGLPPGITIDAKTGLLSGRPTVVSGFSVTITANDGTNTITFSTTLKISAAGGGGNGGVTFTTTTLPQGTVGQAYTVTITVASGVGPFVFGATDLPPGLSLNGLTAVVSGTPSAAGTFYVTFSVTDKGEGNNKVVEIIPLTVLPSDGTNFIFTNSILNNGQLGTPYTDTLVTSGASGTVTFGATGLPAGLTIDPASGKITGTPTAAGTFFAVFTATSGADTISLNRPLWIATSSTSSFHWVYQGLPTAIVNVAYDRQPPLLLITENPGPGAGVVYSASGLPDGISYNAGTGELTGTAIEPGIYPVIFSAVNSNATPPEMIILALDFIVTPPNGGDTNSLPINLWVVKQSIKKGKTASTGAWQAQYIYNANRTKAKIFDPNKDTFTASLGSIPAITIVPPKDKLTGKGSKLGFVSAKGTNPAVNVSLDESAETIKITGKNETVTDTVPGVLPNIVILGNKSFKLDEFYDEKGTFTATSGYRKTAFVVASAKLTAKTANKDSAAYTMLLADPGFVFPGLSTNGNTDTTCRLQVFNGSTVVIDKTFTTLVTSTAGVDKKSGQKTYKLKSGKDTVTTNTLSKFSYDSGSGKLSLALKNLTLTGPLPSTSTDGVHTSVQLTIASKTYFTGITIFAPKAGSYSTKKP